MITLTDPQYGPRAENRLADATDPTVSGAHAALETFYYALNQQDGDALRGVWVTHPLAQLNNPVGGILRGGDAVAELYDRIFAGPVRLSVAFGDVVEYLAEDHAVFAGRERGHYTVGGGEPIPLEIRTSRYFRYADGRWAQFHHHGSIDDPDALQAYQFAVAG